MKSVLAHVRQKGDAYSSLPLFGLLRDRHVPREVRRRFLPASVLLLEAFGNLDRPQQRGAWCPDQDVARWLRCLKVEEVQEVQEVLGSEPETFVADAGHMVWSDEIYPNRALISELCALISATGSVERIAIVEAIEETSGVLFALTAQLVESLEADARQELHRIGTARLPAASVRRPDSGHAVLAAIGLHEEQRQYCIELVDRVFDAFTAWAHDAARHIEQAATIRLAARTG